MKLTSLRQKRIHTALLTLFACNMSRAFAFGLPAMREPGVAAVQAGAVRQPPRRLGVLLRQSPLSLPEGDGSLVNAVNSNSNILLSNEEGAKRLKKIALGTVALSLLLGQRQLISRASFSALEAYKSSLVLRPLRTKVLTGASLAVIGDYLAQLRESRPRGYDVPRAISFAAFDSCYRMFQHVAIPAIVALGTGGVLYGLASAMPMVGGSLGRESIAFFAAMERTFLYQFGLIPFFYYPVFFTFTGFIQGLSVRETVQRAKSSFIPCWKRNLLFWIPIQMIMFGLVDEKWQIPFVCVMGIIWSLILSITAGKAKRDD